MKVFIVHAHAEPQSFNGALTRHGTDILRKAGHEVRVSDLYAMNFDPVSDRRNFTTTKDPDYFKQQVEEAHASQADGFSADIAAELEKLLWCDALVFQFPLWWFGLPAITKGWVDRVFAMGRIYGGGRWYDTGVLAGKRGLLSVTTGGGPAMYSPRGLHGDIDQILFPINHGIFAFTGIAALPPFIVWGPARATPEQRTQYLEDYGKRLLTIPETDPIKYPRLSDYDETFQLRQ